MDNKLKNKIWKILMVLVFIALFVIGYAVGLQKSNNNLDQCSDNNLNQCVEAEEQTLKPCPICGNEVKLQPVKEDFYIQCEKGWWTEDGCGLTTGYYESKNELIEKWNGMN